MLVEPPPPPPAVKLTLQIGNPDDNGRCGLEILVDNVTLSDMVQQREAAAALAAADEAARVERQKATAAERLIRQRQREAVEASEAALGEQRHGASKRKQ